MRVAGRNTPEWNELRLALKKSRARLFKADSAQYDADYEESMEKLNNTSWGMGYWGGCKVAHDLKVTRAKAVLKEAMYELHDSLSRMDKLDGIGRIQRNRGGY